MAQTMNSSVKQATWQETRAISLMAENREVAGRLADLLRATRQGRAAGWSLLRRLTAGPATGGPAPGGR